MRIRPAPALVMLDRHLHGGRRDHADVDDVDADRLEAGRRGVREHLARGPRIAAEHDMRSAVAANPGAERRGVAGDELRREVLAHDAAHAGDGDHQRGVVIRIPASTRGWLRRHIGNAFIRIWVRRQERIDDHWIELLAGAALQLADRDLVACCSRYARLVVIASNASTTETIRAVTGIWCAISPSGNPVPSRRS